MFSDPGKKIKDFLLFLFIYLFTIFRFAID